ncbi:MAG: PQQ-like beta-propeller repeat protein [Gemmataceae bacterium]|nr:PQQ-like beta-propeller repeat protein [Gemmataceae bacterium]
MLRNHPVLAGVVGLVGVIGLAWCGGPTAAQVAVPEVKVQIVAQPGPAFGGRMKQPGMPGTPEGEGVSTHFSAVKLVEKSEYRRFIEVARDCIKGKEWNDAVTALQVILDNAEDYYVQVRDRDLSGKEFLRWTSVKYEANNLLGTMADEGLDVYELRFGAKARVMLEEAKAKGDQKLLGEVAQRYLHTTAGIEANDLLATYFLDRGQFFMAALRFERLLEIKPERAKVSELTMFKAALAFRRAGDVKNSEAVWAKLEPRLRERGGMQMGDDMITIAKLQQALEEIPRPEAFSPHDWAMIRGDRTNNAQAKGTPPLLDTTLWTRRLLLDPDESGQVDKETIDKETPARNRIDQAVNKIVSLGNVPVMPGFFPIAANRLLIYRTYTDIRAVYLHDEEERDSDGKVYQCKPGDIKWKSTEFDGTLANVLSNGKVRGTLDSWLDNSYFPMAGFSGVLFENTTVGTLSSDHRFVYAVDDLAVPPPGNVFHVNNPFIRPQVSQLSEPLRPLVMQNSLWAFDLATGRAKWRLGDPQRRDDPFNGSHFLGVPISIGGKLYALNEKNNGDSGDADLRLVCIDPNKIVDARPHIVQPIQLLGMVQQQSRVTHDASRRTNAVHLAYGEGMLVCPTNAGEVLGVDLTSRSLAWAYPYREQAPQTVNLPGMMQPNRAFVAPGMMANMGGATTVANWKSAPPVIVEGKVVFTAPDASSVHCINLRDGTAVWKKRQMDGDLFLAGVYQGKVIIVGRSSIRALDLHKNGDMIWYQATGELPSGQGVASKNIYYLPLQKGEILAVDIATGQIKAHNRAKDSRTALGNLIFYEGAVIAQSPRDVVAYPQLLSRLEGASAALRTDPENPQKLVNRGELYLADGQVQNAVNDLKRALDNRPAAPLAKRAKGTLYEALTQLLQSDFTMASAKYLDEYRELCKVADDAKENQQRQARFFRIVGQGREDQGNLVDAFQMYREFGSLPIHREQGGIAVLDDPTHRIPVDVWLRGRVAAMFAKATPQERDPLEKKIVEEWKAVEAQRDPNAIRSFVGMFDVPFPVGREARIRLAESIIERNARNDFLEAELSLHQLRTAEFARDAASGGRALAVLALLEEKKGTVESMKQAAAYYRELAALFPKDVLRDGKTGARLLDELAADKRFLPFLAEPGTLWGSEKLGVKEMQVGHSAPALQGFCFYPEGELTPFMKRHRLILDPSNAANPQLRLADLTSGETRWSSSLGSVPINFQFFQYLYQQKGVVNNNIRIVGGAASGYNPNHRFRFYQVKGHLIVFQVGAQVYCLDGNDGKILWQQPLAEQIQQGNPQMVINQVLPDADGRLDMIAWNQFNGQRTRLPIGGVGSVQASHVALVSQKGLVVLDPLRGTTLWKKMDVPPGTHAFGDDHYLFLVDDADGSTGAGRTFRASDGTPLDMPDFGTLYQNRLRLMGRRILAAVPGKDAVTLRLYDIPTAKDIWTKTFAGKVHVLASEDPSLTGVIDSGTGKIVVLDSATGKELMAGSAAQYRITVDDLKNLKDPLLVADRDRFYVALNQPVDASKVGNGILLNNFNNGVRCMPVNGWMAAFHRKSGKTASGVDFKAGDMAWHSSKRIDNQMMVLEQFDLLPVILFSARYNELIGGGAQGNRWVSASASLHKAHGKLVYDSGSRPSNSNPYFDAFNLDLKAGTINLIGFNGTVQHYIDDGRKVPLPPGATTMTGPPPGQLPPTAGVLQPAPGIRIMRVVQPRLVLPAAAPPPAPEPPPPLPKKK